MLLFFAGLSSLSWGAADFAGGIATKRAGGAAPVLVFSQLAGLSVVTVTALVAADNSPGIAGLTWGGLAGMAGVIGLGLLYTGLARGRMAVVAPVAAVAGAVVPVFYGIFTGERPELVAWLGVAIAIPAIWLVGATSDGDHEGPSGLGYGIAAGLGFGGFFIFVAQTDIQSGLWPLVAARSASISMVAIVTVVLGRSLHLARSARPSTVTAGVLDIVANILALVAIRGELVILVAVLASLYPAGTIVLARWLLDERVTRHQLVGLVLAGASVVLIAGGA